MNLNTLVPSLRRFGPAVLAATLSFAVAPSIASDTYRVVHTYPHDRQAFTQGLIYTGGHLYESTGLEGHSSLRMEDLETGKSCIFKEVSNDYFAEGLTEWGDTLAQLTWQNHIALVYDRLNLSVSYGPFHTNGEGWGLTCRMGKQLILSDGTSTLRFLDPANLP